MAAPAPAADPGPAAAPGLGLAEALCARICHDIASPLGTLIGSLELMTERAGALSDALPLAVEVAASMGDRLRLLRAAWAGDCGGLGAKQLHALAAGLPGRVRVSVDGLQGTFAPPVARVLVNLLLLGAEALPRGGALALSGAAGGALLATVEGPDAAWPATLAAGLASGAPTGLANPRLVQPPLVLLLARAAGLLPSLPPGAAAPALLLTPDPAPALT